MSELNFENASEGRIRARCGCVLGVPVLLALALIFWALDLKILLIFALLALCALVMCIGVWNGNWQEYLETAEGKAFQKRYEERKRLEVQRKEAEAARLRQAEVAEQERKKQEKLALAERLRWQKEEERLRPIREREERERQERQRQQEQEQEQERQEALRRIRDDQQAAWRELEDYIQANRAVLDDIFPPPLLAAFRRLHLSPDESPQKHWEAVRDLIKELHGHVAEARQQSERERGRRSPINPGGPT